MKLRSLISLAAILPVLRESGDITLAVEDGTTVTLNAPALKEFVVGLESKAAKLETDLAAEKTASGVVAEKLKTAEERAKSLLVDLTKSELDPLVGVDLHCLSPADRDDLAIVRAADETLYARQLASVKARFAKGVEALKAAGGGAGTTTTTTTTTGAPAVADVLPTKAADLTPPANGATTTLDAGDTGPDALTEKLKARSAQILKEQADQR